MADFYTAPTAGPTADYAGDPNDYGANTGSANNFNFNQIASGVSSIASPLFGFIQGMYAISQNQPVTNTGGAPYYGNYPQQQQQQPTQSSNALMYAVAAVFILVLVGLGIYAFKKS